MPLDAQQKERRVRLVAALTTRTDSDNVVWRPDGPRNYRTEFSGQLIVLVGTASPGYYTLQVYPPCAEGDKFIHVGDVGLVGLHDAVMRQADRIRQAERERQETALTELMERLETNPLLDGPFQDETGSSMTTRRNNA